MQQSGWGSARLPGSIVSPYIDSAAWQLDPIFSPEPFLSVKSPLRNAVERLYVRTKS